MLTPATWAMRFVVTASTPCDLSTLRTAPSTASTVCSARSCLGSRRATNFLFRCGFISFVSNLSNRSQTLVCFGDFLGRERRVNAS